MKLQSRSREEPEINVISLVDVLLVLVLFFMVSTSFLRETEISLSLPEANVEGPATATDDARPSFVAWWATHRRRRQVRGIGWRARCVLVTHLVALLA